MSQYTYTIEDIIKLYTATPLNESLKKFPDLVQEDPIPPIPFDQMVIDFSDKKVKVQSIAKQRRSKPQRQFNQKQQPKNQPKKFVQVQATIHSDVEIVGWGKPAKPGPQEKEQPKPVQPPKPASFAPVVVKEQPKSAEKSSFQPSPAKDINDNTNYPSLSSHKPTPIATPEQKYEVDESKYPSLNSGSSSFKPKKVATGWANLK